jgi:uncharacterized protein (TIGR02147 family)
LYTTRGRAAADTKGNMTLRLLREEVRKIRLFDALSGVEVLKRLYAGMKRVAPSYSYRAFALDLGFGPTNYLHLICNGRRPLSVSAARRIATSLRLGEREERYFVLLARHGTARSAVEREVAFEEIVDIKARLIGGSESKDGFEYFSEWWHAAIREMVLLPGFCPEPEWMASRLVPRVTPDEARRSWELLSRLGLVRRDAHGRWRQAEARIEQPEGARSLAIIRYHQKMAELGKECVMRVKARDRDVTVLTVPMTRALFETLRAEAAAWQQRILAAAESLDDGEEIYQINIQIFPLTERSTGAVADGKKIASGAGGKGPQE